MGTASLAVTSQQDPVRAIPGSSTIEFSELYRNCAEAVYRTALRITGNAADAEDVLQNVFLRVLDHRVSLDPMWSPDRYLRRAATNASIDLIRKRTSRAETGFEESLAGSKEHTLVLKERIRRALASIPAEDAELFVLCYLEGYTYDELAEQFQVERGTVGSRLFRIRAVLKKVLGEQRS